MRWLGHLQHDGGAVLLWGTIAIAFGVLAFVWPGVTVATLVLRFGFLALAGRTLLLLTATGGRRQRQDRRLILGVFENMLGVELRSVLQRTNPALSRLDSGWAVTDVGIPYPDAAETSYRRHSRVFAKSPHKERWSNIILTAIDKKRGY